MMRKVLLACALFTAACDDDEESVAERDGGGADAGLDAQSGDGSLMDAATVMKTFTLRFRATIGNAELRCGQDYPGQGTTQVTVTPRDLRFYVQSVSLLSASGAAVPLVFSDQGNYQTRDVALLNFTDRSGECGVGPTELNTSLIGVAPAGNYQGAVITIGVPELLNHSDPTRAPAPLQAPGASWDWTSGYRFFIAELPMAGAPPARDAGLPDGGVLLPGLGLLHLGSTACTKDGTVFSCLRPNRAEVRLSAFDPDRQAIVVDLGALFAQSDLAQHQQCHSGGKGCPSLFQALGVDWDSGLPAPGQTVFRVE